MDLSDLLGDVGDGSLADILGEDESTPAVVSSKIETHWTPNRSWGNFTFIFKSMRMKFAKKEDPVLRVQTLDGIVGLSRLTEREREELPELLR